MGSTHKLDGGDTAGLAIRSVGDDASFDRTDNLGEIFLKSREKLMLESSVPKKIDQVPTSPNCCKGESRHKATEARERASTDVERSKPGTIRQNERNDGCVA